MTTLVPSSEDVRIYETCVLYPHPLTQKEESVLIKEIDAVFAEMEAKEITRNNWGRRGLAYTIKGFDQGVFLVMYHEMLPANLKELDANLKLIPNLLRHMIVKPVKGYQVVDYSKKFGEWQQEQSVEADKKKKEKEERLKKRMLNKRKPTKKAKEEPKEKTDAKKIKADIDTLLDSADLSL